jgi:APA family basic amino acid/polyamine antiporter
VSKVSLKRELRLFDVTNLVVGAIIGADIYVAAALAASLIGPASLLAWVAAGVLALMIALCFAYSATLMPSLGGPYAYVKEAAGSLPGFLAGWALLLAEWASLAVFPVAFVRYFSFYFPDLGLWAQVGLKATFMLLIFITNVIGIRAAGRANDILTIGKLGPLFLFMIFGLSYIGLHSKESFSYFVPFFRGPWRGFGKAVVLVFWAYAGFELATIPADEIENPGRTIPRAIVVGMSIVLCFYLVTNFIINGVLSQEILSQTPAPLATASAKVMSIIPRFGLIGGALLWLGALISITGADESGTVGTSRLAYAMAADGLLPSAFCRLHPRFRSPHLNLAILALTAFGASLAGTLTQLISASVFFLAMAYFGTSLSLYVLERRYRERAKRLRLRWIVPTLGALASLFLITQVGWYQIVMGIVLLAIGIPVYIFYAPKRRLHNVYEQFLSREAVLRRAYGHLEGFLAHPLHHLSHAVYRRKSIPPPWHVEGAGFEDDPQEQD